MSNKIPTLIQKLAHVNEMLHMVGKGTRGVSKKISYPSITIEAPTLPKSAFDLICKKVLEVVDESLVEIDKKALENYNELLNEIKNSK